MPSLGYEASDMCLRRLDRSLTCGLTSARDAPVFCFRRSESSDMGRLF